MSWPTTEVYKRLLQRPSRHLLDPNLSNLDFEVDRWGIPSARSGRSAIVFQAKRGETAVAVRLFLKEPARATLDRYKELARWTGRGRLAYFPKVELFEDGLVHGVERLPVIVLEWVDGLRLDDFVAKDGLTPEELIDLAARVLDLALSLREDGVVHGDVQLKNLIVTAEGSLVLVDLDSVWLPGSEDHESLDVGHRHFQHPERIRCGGWTRDIDAFSFASIYISLKAMAYDEGMRKDVSDSHLALTSDDYQDPTNSDTFFRLASNRDLDVRRMSEVLFEWCVGGREEHASIGEFVKAAPSQAMIDAPRKMPAFPKGLVVDSSVMRVEVVAQIDEPELVESSTLGWSRLLQWVLFWLAAGALVAWLIFTGLR